MSHALELLRQVQAAAEPNTAVTFDGLHVGLQQFNQHQIQFNSRHHGMITGTVRIGKILPAHHADRIPELPNLRSSGWFSIRYIYESASESMFAHVYIVYDNPYPQGSPLYGGIAVVQEMTVGGVVLPQLAVAQSAPVFFQKLHQFELKRISDTHGKGLQRQPKPVTAADTVKRVSGIWCGYQVRFDDGTIVPTESGCKGKCMVQYDPVTGRIYQHGRNGFEFNGWMMPGREQDAVAAAEPVPHYSLESLERDLNHAPAPVYRGVCNHSTEVQLYFFEAEDFMNRRGYEQLAFEVNVIPNGEDVIEACAFVNVHLHENKIEVLSTKPAIGMEWNQVLYHKTFPRPELLTARFILALLDRELRRTNYYENFARWASGLKPLEMKP